MTLGRSTRLAATGSRGSTWIGALALALLNQVLLALGLAEATQFVAFGEAILAGMIVSGDRIVAGLGTVLQHPGMRALLGEERSAGTWGRGAA